MQGSSLTMCAMQGRACRALWAWKKRKATRELLAIRLAALTPPHHMGQEAATGKEEEHRQNSGGMRSCDN